MSFKYRTVGYSPEYAITTAGVQSNDFGNPNNYESGSSINVKLGSEVIVETGGVMRVTDAPVVATDVTNLNYVDTELALKFDKAGGTISGATNFSAGTLTLFADPSAPMEAVTKQYTDLRIHRDGSVQMTGNLLLKVGTDPTLDDHAARKAYVDARINTRLPIAGGTLTGYLTLNALPVDPLHAATRSYVDGKLGSFDAGDGLYVVPVSVVKSGTYSQAGTEITVNIPNHGFGVWTVISVNFTSGDSNDGTYSIVSLVGSDAFTITSADTEVTSGDVTVTLETNQVSTRSSTLNITADDINLDEIHTNELFNLTSGAGSFATSTWYDQFKVDGYGRVTSGRNTPTINSQLSGTYNNVTVSGGYVTNVSNINYVKPTDTFNITGDVVGTGTQSGGINVTLPTSSVAPGTYLKVVVDNKGRIQSGKSTLSASDISTALGFAPSQSDIRFIHLKASFAAYNWGSIPVNLSVVSSDNWPIGSEGFSISGTYLYVPRGVYHVTFYGSTNWWYSWYNYWWWGGWWGNYWNYYYQPAMVEVSGIIQTAAFSSYGGWWWYWNTNHYYPDKSQDFVITDTYNISSAGYMRFHVPHLYGVNYWYNVKIVKMR